MGPGMTSNLHSLIVSNRRMLSLAESLLTCVVPTERTVSASDLLFFLCAYLLEPGHCLLEC